MSDLVGGEQDTFYWAWLDAFEGVTDHVLAGEGHQLSGQFTFYPGKHVLPANYRGRVKSPSDAIVEHYTVAVAYTKAPYLTAGF